MEQFTAEDAEKSLSQKDLRLDAAWYLRLVSNYLPLRDTAADWRIRIRAWLAERKLKTIAQAIKDRRPHTHGSFCKSPAAVSIRNGKSAGNGLTRTSAAIRKNAHPAGCASASVRTARSVRCETRTIAER